MFLKHPWKRYNLNRCIFILFVCACVVLWNAVTKADEAKNYKKYYDQTMEFQREKTDASLSAAIKKNPKNAGLYYQRALSREYGRKFQNAIRDYTMVIKLDLRSYPKARWHRGLCFYHLKLYHLAIRDYSCSLAVSPKCAKILSYRATAYLKIGMIGKAKKDLVTIIKYDPKYAPAARSTLKQLLMGRSDF